MDADSFLTEQSEQGRFSGTALVRRAGETLLNTGYGLADRESGRPNDPRTAFQIASVSKQFTAAAVLLLQEHGALSVRDHVGRWIPHASAVWHAITIHHLLSNTSGIGHWQDFPDLSLFEPIPWDDLLQVFGSKPLKFEPGTSWSYSSPGWVVLAHIVEQVSGQAYAAFLAEQIFGPLGMTSSGAGNHAPDPDRQAIGYSGGKRSRSFELDHVGKGAGDIWSTTEDLTRWDAALAAPGLLTDASLQAMFTAHARVPGSDDARISNVHYGYGWFLARMHGHRLIFHPGDNAGFRALNAWFPDDDIVIILLANNDDVDLEGLGMRLAEMVVQS